MSGDLRCLALSARTFSASQKTAKMSRDEGPRDNGRSDQEHKAFVGGISWHMNGDELKDSKSFLRLQISDFDVTFSNRQLLITNTFMQHFDRRVTEPEVLQSCLTR